MSNANLAAQLFSSSEPLPSTDVSEEAWNDEELLSAILSGHLETGFFARKMFDLYLTWRATQNPRFSSRRMLSDWHAKKFERTLDEMREFGFTKFGYIDRIVYFARMKISPGIVTRFNQNILVNAESVSKVTVGSKVGRIQQKSDETPRVVGPYVFERRESLDGKGLFNLFEKKYLAELTIAKHEGVATPPTLAMFFDLSNGQLRYTKDPNFWQTPALQDDERFMLIYSTYDIGVLLHLLWNQDIIMQPGVDEDRALLALFPAWLAAWKRNHSSSPLTIYGVKLWKFLKIVYGEEMTHAARSYNISSGGFMRSGYKNNGAVIVLSLGRHGHIACLSPKRHLESAAEVLEWRAQEVAPFLSVGEGVTRFILFDNIRVGSH